MYLCCRWHDLQGALELYRGHLARALEVHAFNRDVDDTSQRVAEKVVAMSTDDVGRDLAAVEQLQRKQEALEGDMTAIEGKLKVQTSTWPFKYYTYFWQSYNVHYWTVNLLSLLFLSS